MSKGYGKLQRAILAVLSDDKQADTLEIACRAHDVTPDANGCATISPSQRAATARALYRLQADGAVVRLFCGRHGRTYWGSPACAAAYAQRYAATFGASDLGAHLHKYLETA